MKEWAGFHTNQVVENQSGGRDVEEIEDKGFRI
jgi:hypothetical protein